MWELFQLTIIYWVTFILNDDIHKDTYKKDRISCHHFIFWVMTISIPPLHTKYHVISLWINQQSRFAQPDSIFILSVIYRVQSNDAALLLENYQYANIEFNTSLFQVITADPHKQTSLVRTWTKSNQQINTNSSWTRKALCLYSTLQQLNMVTQQDTMKQYKVFLCSATSHCHISV